ncbi:MAG: type II toxin-antitoxin system YafQ family toxin [Moraxellaceae bacterium]|nr:type II toxin-antitoxin system YafQ family toxin [Moraxellaceae bacterium]
MREILRTNRFKKQYKLMKKRGKDLTKLKQVIIALSNDEPLAEAHRDHKLTGNLSIYRECHIEPDWLLIYQKQDTIENKQAIKLLYLVETGSHSDLFKN